MYQKHNQVNKANGQKNVKCDCPKPDFKADIKDLGDRLEYLIIRLEKEGL